MRVVLDRGPAAALAVMLAACGGPAGSLEVTPGSLDWGEVDFQQELPEGGYGQTELSLSNVGEAPIDIQVKSFDFARLCLAGFSENPVLIPTLDPGATYLLYVGVCSYELGEQTLQVTGSLDFESDGEPSIVSVPFSFTPIRNILGDTG